jgi:succinoglycan biosynthesis transport protein ExoP
MLDDPSRVGWTLDQRVRFVPQLDPSQQAADTGPTFGQQIDLVRAFLHRRYLWVLFFLVLALPIGAFVAFTSPKTYTATATMMVETRKGPLETQASAGPLDAAWFDTQLQSLKSVNVLGYVVKQLHLADDPEFLRSDSTVLEKVRARLGWSPPELKSEAERVNHAIAIVAGGLVTQRVGQSYMIKIDFHGRDPELAGKIANEMANGYIFDQTNAKYQANRRAGDWLQERLQTLREQAANAERAVVQFKAKNNIITAGGTQIDQKQLGEASTQLGAARAHTAELEARLERIKAVRQTYQLDRPNSGRDESFSEEMSNGVIAQLRPRYLDLVNREAEYAARYGANHQSVVNLRTQIRAMRHSIADELGRIEETFKSEFEIAKRRQDELEKAFAGAIVKTQDASQAQVTLFSLEAAAKSYRSLYDSFLRQHTESVQEQTYPVSDARLISTASVAQTGPNTPMIWLIAVAAGAMVGVGFGALRELLDRGFRTGDHVKSALNTDCVALIPRLRAGKSRVPQLSFRQENVFSMSSGETPDVEPRSGDILWAAVDAPNSAYADAIRSIKFAVDADANGGCNVIGLTSYLPTEGKSTVAAGIATMLAQSGRRTLLIDCDVRNPSLSRALAPNAKVGFLEVASGEASLVQAVLRDGETRLAFLPTVLNQNMRNPTELLGSVEARRLFDSFKVGYEFVIVDMAPLVSAVDIRAGSRLVDSYLFVIEWGATKMDSVQHALSHQPAVQSKMIGAVLNKVDFDSLGRYEPYGYSHQYYGRSGNPRH